MTSTTGQKDGMGDMVIAISLHHSYRPQTPEQFLSAGIYSFTHSGKKIYRNKQTNQPTYQYILSAEFHISEHKIPLK